MQHTRLTLTPLVEILINPAAVFSRRLLRLCVCSHAYIHPYKLPRVCRSHRWEVRFEITAHSFHKVLHKYKLRILTGCSSCELLFGNIDKLQHSSTVLLLSLFLLLPSSH